MIKLSVVLAIVRKSHCFYYFIIVIRQIHFFGVFFTIALRRMLIKQNMVRDAQSRSKILIHIQKRRVQNRYVDTYIFQSVQRLS